MSTCEGSQPVKLPGTHLRRVLEAAEHLYRSGTFLVPDDPVDPYDEWSMELLAVHEDNEALHRLRAELEQLSLEERLQLLALMWLGRGDYPTVAWADALAAAAAVRDGYVTEYLTATAQLADLLRLGARKLGAELAH